MIDEKKLIEELEMHCNNINPNSHLYLVKGAWDDCIKIIKRQPKVGEWIPCSEWLPEAYKEVIGCDYQGNRYVACLYKDNIFGNIWRQWNGGALKLNVIIAWLPLPEPYKGEK